MRHATITLGIMTTAFYAHLAFAVACADVTTENRDKLYFCGEYGICGSMNTKVDCYQTVEWQANGSKWEACTWNGARSGSNRCYIDKKTNKMCEPDPAGKASLVWITPGQELYSTDSNGNKVRYAGNGLGKTCRQNREAALLGATQ